VTDPLSSWHGPLPSGWGVCRLGDISRIVNGFPFDSAGFTKTGSRRLIRIRDLLADDDQVFFDGPAPGDVTVYDGDVLVGMDGDFNVTWWNRGEALLNQRLCCVRPRTVMVTRFLYYALPVPLRVINDLTYFTTVKHLSSSQVAAVRLPLPPVDRQLAIVDFLDHATATIDALIEQKEHLVARCEERRAALISEVILGARSPATRRSTGTPLGSIPEHWAAKRLMFLTTATRPIMYGIVLPGPNVDQGVPIVKSGNCTRETLRPELLHKTTFEIEAGYERSRLATNDIVYAIRGSIGMAALVPEDVAGANLTQDAARIAPAPNVNSHWLLYAVQSSPVWAQLAAGIVGATVKGINIRDLKRPFVPVPPRHEQDEMAAYLDTEIGKLHELEAATQTSIERLREYRHVLIASAVTGQLLGRERIRTATPQEAA
jgi:type I restriction enzyme S subunit